MGRLRASAAALLPLLLALVLPSTAAGAAPPAPPPKTKTPYLVAAPSCPFAKLLGDAGGYPLDIAKDAAQNAKAQPPAQPALASATSCPAADAKAPSSSFSPPSCCSKDEYGAITAEFAAAIRNGTLVAPKAARLAFHSSFPYFPAFGLGGPSGAYIRFPAELGFAENNGLDEPLRAVQAIQQRHSGCLTLADAIALAGAVAVEVAGGPAIAWLPGRRDALVPPPQSAVPLSARLPDATFTAPAIGYTFGNSGLSARETVALIGGGHSFGGFDARVSGFNGSWTSSGDAWPQNPKNKFFTDLVGLSWEPVVVKKTARLQFVPSPGQEHKAAYIADNGAAIARLPSDMALLENPTYAELSRMYARDEKTFLSDFARAFQRLSQLGAGEESGSAAAWRLDPSFVWLGLNGTATNYGTKIAPM